MGDAAWEWDPSLFAGAAAYYEQGRLPYAPGLAAAFGDVFGDTSGDRLLDVGCGPGTVTLQLAARFDAVVGLDPDGDMLAEAERLAWIDGITNATWVELRAEELPARLGRFRVVTFAQSFHWMDRPTVAAAVRSMLDGDGAVVHVDNRHQDGLGPHPDLPAVPAAAVDLLRRTYLGDERRAGATVRTSSPTGEEVVFEAAGFVGPEVVVVPDGRLIERSIDDVVAEVFSISATAPHLFGGQRTAFEADLRAVLAHHSRDGHFGVRLPDNKLNVWRPAGEAVTR